MRNKHGLPIDEFFLKTTKLKLGLCTISSIQTVVFNMLLLGFLLTHKEFRSWVFFPVTMQCFIDICEPVVANVINEWQLMSKYYAEEESVANVYPRTVSYVRG